MKPESLIELLAERPFRPLLLRLSDGRSHEVRHPELAIVGEDFVTIGIPRDEESKVAVKLTHCTLSHLVEARSLVS
ncbi:MAG: hypothetical protein AAF790_07675 [Planctomycetota bacterium]